MDTNNPPVRPALAAPDETPPSRRPQRRSHRPLCAALVGLAALAAFACAPADEPGGSGQSAALFALSTAQSAADAAGEAQRAVAVQSQLAEVTLALALATAELTEAIASGDGARIDDATIALGAAKQSARRIASRLGTETASVPAEGADAGAGSDLAAPGPSTPGAGIEVRMARANWDTGYMQAAVFRALLGELGYVVSDPAAAEMTPAEFYPQLAKGELDFWANGWFPTHDNFMFAEDLEMNLPDGGVVSDYARRAGTSMTSGGLQGFLVDVHTADELGVRAMADIAANPAPWDSDGDGLAEIAGCDDGWGCQQVIDQTIVANGWEDTIEQVSAEYAALWDDQIARLERGEPVLAYTWTPSAYITQLVPGRNAYWLAVPKPILGQHGAAALPDNQCPAQPCTMGFTAADIGVVGNNAFLDANPAAARLFELVTFDVLDVALQNVRYQGGENTEEDVRRHAAAWIADNRPTVDAWLAEARAAA